MEDTYGWCLFGVQEGRSQFKEVVLEIIETSVHKYMTMMMGMKMMMVVMVVWIIVMMVRAVTKCSFQQREQELGPEKCWKKEF